MIMCKFRHDACDAYCYIAKQYDFCKDENNCPVFKLQEENDELKQIIKNIVNAFNNYECAGPEQEQNNCWEILRDIIHDQFFKF